LLHEVIRLNTASGNDPNGESEEAVASIETRIAELRSTLAERDKQQVVADQIGEK
jgi:hypothetical protein